MSTQDILKWYLSMGVDETIGDEPHNHFASKPIIKTDAPIAALHQNDKPTPITRAKPTITLSAKEAEVEAAKLAKAAKDLDALKIAIENYDGCGLSRTAMNTIFAEGSRDAKIMIVGDAPNADEDRFGKPFVGEIGALLDKMMAAIGLTRETGFYVTNILPWRPPGGRKPNDDEVTICLPFIKRHIELMAPQVLFIMGATAISALLGDDRNTKDVRGHWQTLDFGKQKIATIASYHPSRLIKQPQAKKAAWQDLLEIKRKIG